MASTMWEAFTLNRISWAVGVLLTTLLLRFWQKLHYQRGLLKGLPGPPHSYLFGSLRSMGEVLREQPSRAAPQSLGITLKEKYGLGDYWYLDPWPVNDPILMITNV